MRQTANALATIVDEVFDTAAIDVCTVLGRQARAQRGTFAPAGPRFMLAAEGILVHRIAGLDIPNRLSGVAPIWVSKSACALLGVGIAVALRTGVDRIAPGVAPYAFVYPACLLAALLGGWQAGVGTMVIAGGLAWQFVVPRAALSGGQMHYQLAAAGIAAFTAIVIIAVGEGFRAAAGRVLKERNEKLAERELLFRELQHRVGNDFTIACSLLDLQRRRSNNAETRADLEQAMSRLRSVSRVHRHIYALADAKSVDLRRYILDLCAGLTDAVLPPAGLTLTCDCEQAYMARDPALALGLATNELITNSIKHGFPEGREGTIRVSFSRAGDSWRLTVADDGVGQEQSTLKTGLGTSLIEQFVRQIGGKVCVSCSNGTTAMIDLPGAAATETNT